jgi:hypothetical protein
MQKHIHTHTHTHVKILGSPVESGLKIEEKLTFPFGFLELDWSRLQHQPEDMMYVCTRRAHMLRKK